MSTSAHATFTPRPITATTSASSKRIASGRKKRTVDSTIIAAATTPSSKALVKAPRTSIFHVPNAKRLSADQRRARRYANPAIDRATTWVAMCQPSASSAIEPVIQPAAISATIVAAVIATTIHVRSSPAGLPGSNAWLWRKAERSWIAIEVILRPAALLVVGQIVRIDADEVGLGIAARSRS